MKTGKQPKRIAALGERTIKRESRTMDNSRAFAVDGSEIPTTGVPMVSGFLSELCDGYEPPVEPPTPIKVVRDMKTERVAIYCPYQDSVVAGMKAVEGRRWDAENKVNTFPLGTEEEVLALVRRFFDSVHVVTVDGEVKKPRASPRSKLS